MDEVNVIIFVVDGLSGLIDSDYYIVKLFYKIDKFVIVVVNKIDDIVYVYNVFEFYVFGFGDLIVVFSYYGIGVGDLLDKILSYMVEEEKVYEKGIIFFLVLGWLNVGKSLLVNVIIGEECVIVLDIFGIIIDVIDIIFIKDK